MSALPSSNGQENTERQQESEREESESIESPRLSSSSGPSSSSTGAGAGEYAFISRSNQLVSDDPTMTVPTTTVESVFRTTAEPMTRSTCFRRPCTNILLLLGLISAVIIVAILAVIVPSTWNQQDETTATTMTCTIDDMPWAPLPPPSSTSITRIAFGSCAYAEVPQPYWDTLKQQYRAHLTLLLGDNVYGECRRPHQCDELLNAYRMLGALPSFQGAKSSLPMLAVLDDHDYGVNDCDASNPYKEVALDLFFDFFDIQDDRRIRRDGVYQSYLWGEAEAAKINDRRLQVILLDTRFGRSPFVPTDEPMAPRKEVYMEDTAVNSTRRMMSETQWTWLEQELAKPANVRLIVSSIQVLADGTGFECWRMLPQERTRLVQLLEATQNASATFLLSGDRHVGAFYQYNQLVEVTASAWTHTIPFGAFGTNCSTSEECDETDERRMTPFVRVNNFGTIDIDWEDRIVALAIRRAESSPYIAYREPYTRNSSRTDAGEVLHQITFNIP